ncbi:MAG: hypothetical protein ACRCW0_09175 [Clostridium sp.]
MKKKKIIISVLVIIALLFIGIFFTYNYSLKPQVPVVSINKTVDIDTVEMAKKFLPKDIDLTFKEISAESHTTFTASEITDLFIATINEIPEVKEYVSGLKVTLDNNLINLYVDINYKGIPLGAKLIFSCHSIDGKGIFHFEKGNLGFINISKDMIFNNLTDTSLLQFNKDNGDIILSFQTIKLLNIRNMEIKDDQLIINFKGTIRFWDWLKK